MNERTKEILTFVAGGALTLLLYFVKGADEEQKIKKEVAKQLPRAIIDIENDPHAFEEED